MRITAPFVAAASVGFAIALVWLNRQAPESIVAHDEYAADMAPVQSETVAPAPPTPAEATSTPGPVRTPLAPLPGETAVMPMAQLLASAQLPVAPELVELERNFGAEPVDANWAPRAEAAILSQFADMPGLALLSLQVECRSTMCRVQAASRKSPDGFNILLDSIGFEARFRMAIIDPSDALQSVAYLDRQTSLSE